MTDLTDVIPLNVVVVQTCAVWGDRLSPGVWCRDEKLARQNFDFRFDLVHSVWNDMSGSVAASALGTLLCDLGCPVTEDMIHWERLEGLGDDR